MAINYSAYSVTQLREMLISKGYPEDDAISLTRLECAKLLSELESDDDDEAFHNAELEEDKVDMGVNTTQQSNVPNVQFGSKEWQEQIMSLFEDKEKWVQEEKDENGKVRKIDTVFAKALARVGRLVYGQPISDGPVSEQLTFDGPDKTPVAYVRYEVVISTPVGPRVFRALADASALNTNDKFLAFPLASAETKAMGRAWTKALGINVFAKEEFSTSTADWNEDGELTSHQIRTITNKCIKLNISVYRLLNMTARKEGDKITECRYDEKVKRYTGLDDVRLTKQKGTNLIGILGMMERGELSIDESFKVPDVI